MFKVSQMKFGIGWFTLFIVLFCGISCDMRWHLDEIARMPIVETDSVFNVSATTAQISGYVEWDGDTPLIETGICFSTGDNPTIESSTVVTESSEGMIMAILNGLSSSTAYRARVYAINSAGVSYGQVIEFSTLFEPGLVQALECGSISIGGELIAGAPVSSVIVTIPYVGGNGQDFLSREIQSNGVSGLTLELQAGTLNIGDGYFTLEITGIPSSAGLANFALDICGQSCLIEVSIIAGSIASLECGLAFFSGNLLSGVYSNDLEIIIPYTGGNGGLSLINSINSSGVIGLTAVPDIANFDVGDGIITYTLIGTPVGEGYATFNLLVNDQVCVISLPVVDNDNHSCGAPSVHNPFLSYGSMTDQDGNEYKTVLIGDEEWMAENLNTNRYRNGDNIPPIQLDADWSATTSGTWSYYSYDSDLSCPYGKLYNWFAVDDNRGLCPIGWHVPSQEEYGLLISILGGYSLASNAMRTTGNAYWATPNSSATNSSGFSALGGGSRWWNGSYTTIPNMDFGVFWSSAASGAEDARLLLLTNSTGQLSFTAYDKNIGASVRCVRD
jgi:uncharacterized protein (TIGR02145 family)